MACPDRPTTVTGSLSPAAAWALALERIASAGAPGRRSNVYGTPDPARGYEQTTIRAVAARAGVDASMATIAPSVQRYLTQAVVPVVPLR